MHKQHLNRKPDFFAVLVLLVLLSFGLTVFIQLMASDVESVAESQPIKTVEVRS